MNPLRRIAAANGPRWAPHAARVFAWAYVISIGVIAVAGATVRLTGSGLGCSTWPDCHPGTLLPDASVAVPLFHQIIEFTHRAVAATSLIAALGTFVSLAIAKPVRRQLLWLSSVGVAGVAFQAILGAIVVFNELTWWIVASHLLLPLSLLFVAVVVAARLREPDGPPRYLIGGAWVGAVWLMVWTLLALCVLGVMTTASGPHGGDSVASRLAIPMGHLAGIHRMLMYTFLGLLLVIGIGLIATRAPRRVLAALGILVLATMIQAAIGLTQWALNVPANLVIAHVGGATVVVATCAWFVMSVRTRDAAIRVAESPEIGNLATAIPAIDHAATDVPAPTTTTTTESAYF